MASTSQAAAAGAEDDGSRITAKKASRAHRIAQLDAPPEEILSRPAQVCTPFQVAKHKREAARAWDVFFKANTSFFKDRHWTKREFVELAESSELEQGGTVLEAGCGLGNFVWPLLEELPNHRFHCFDFSPRAVKIVEDQSADKRARVNPFVHDLTDSAKSLRSKLLSCSADFRHEGETDEQLMPDIISCIFVLSALPPSKQRHAIRTLLSVLKVGGHLIMRDYALHDYAQLRFHALPSASYSTVPSLLSRPREGVTGANGSAAGAEGDEKKKAAEDEDEDLDESGKAWYRRGDGTMSYFFTQDELDRLVTRACEPRGGEEGDSGETFKVRLASSRIVEKDLTNRSEGTWVAKRRWVQMSWQRIA